MNLFEKRETLAKSIPLMALMAAINLIISVITGFSIFITAFLLLLLPLSSTIVEIYCKDRYYPIYALSCLGLSLAATFWNLQTTIFYLIPSLFTGYIFGFMVKRKFSSIWSILIAALVQMGISFAFIPLVNSLFETNIILNFETILHLQNYKYIDVFVPFIVLLFSFVQIVLSFLVTSNELKRITKMEIIYSKSHAIPAYFCFLSVILTAMFYFLNMKICLIFFVISFYFAIYEIIMCLNEHRYKDLIPYAVASIFTFFAYSFMFKIMKEPIQFITFVFLPLSISIISLIVSFLRKKQKKIK